MNADATLYNVRKENEALMKALSNITEEKNGLIEKGNSMVEEM